MEHRSLPRCPGRRLVWWTPVGVFFFCLFSRLWLCPAQSADERPLELRGTVQLAAICDVQAPANGYLKKVLVQPGDQVKAGEVVALIDSDNVDDVSDTVVRAPIAGTIVRLPTLKCRPVTTSANRSGTVIVSIADESKLIVEARVVVSAVSQIQLDQKMLVTAASCPGEKMPAVITFIAPISTTMGGEKGFTIQALIEKPCAKLRPDAPAELTVLRSEAASPAK